MGSCCADSRADGFGWKESCRRAGAHHLSSRRQSRNLLEEVEEFSTWNNCRSICLHCTPGCSEEKIHHGQDETRADRGSSADAH